MGELFKKIKLNALVTAAIYAALGLVLLFWPGLSADIFCMALGLVLIACGLVDAVIFLRSRDGSLYAGFHLVMGIILAVMGVYLMTQPQLVVQVVPRIVGLLLGIHAIGDFGDAITLRRSGSRRWITALVLGLLTLALGAVLIYDPFDAFATVVRVIGAFLLYDGLSDLWITLCVSRAVRQAAKDAENTKKAVDVEFTDVKDQP